jgi:hypothetical protein
MNAEVKKVWIHVFIFCLNRTPRWLRVSPLLILIALAANVRAGSIFDDDWMPPRANEKPRSGDSASPPSTKNAPVVNPTSPGDTPKESPTAGPGTASETAAPLPLAAVRLPMPQKAAVMESRRQLKAAFEPQLKDHSAVARRKLAETLLQESEKSTYNAADRFAILGGAIEAAKEASSLRQCLQASDKLAELFDVDGRAVETEAALTMKLQAPADAETADNIVAGMELVDELVAAENFKDAERIDGSLRLLTAGHPDLRVLVMKQSEAVVAARVSFEQIQPILDKLKNSPIDATANLAAGLHYCLKVGQWSKGLRFLARGNDSALKDLATLELGKPTDGKIALKLAADWWDRSEAKGTTEGDSTAMKIHAGEWYRLGQNDASGLEARAVQTRLAKIALLDPVAARNAAIAGSGQHSGGFGPPQTIDLLRLIDVRTDSITGNWAFQKDGLAFDGKDCGRIRILYEPPAEYDLQADFTVRKVVSYGDVSLVCSRGGDRFAANTAFATNTKCDFVGSTDTSRLITSSAPVYRNNGSYTLRVEVRKDYVAAYIDKKLVARSAAVIPQNIPGFYYVGDRILGIRTFDSIVFHSLKLVEIGQHGKKVTGFPVDQIPVLPKLPPSDPALAVIKLIPLIDVEKDAFQGRWELEGGSIKSFGGKSRLRIPYQPPREYDFVVKFRRLEGDAGIGQVAPVGPHGVLWLMGGFNNTGSGFDSIKTQWIGANPNTVRIPSFFQNGHKYTGIVYVRKDYIAASIDGKLIAEQKTDGSDVDIGANWGVGEKVLGLVSESKSVIYDAIEIREIQGHGTVVPHPELHTLSISPPDDKPLQVVDLLPMIDLSKDAIDGVWTKGKKGEILSPDSGKLRIPYHPPDEYDVHVRLRRIAGANSVAFLLSHGTHNFRWFAGYENKTCGFDLIKNEFHNQTTSVSDIVFQDPYPYDLIVYVRNGSLTASINGKVISHYKTDFSDMTIVADSFIGDGVIGLKTTNTKFAFDVLEIKEITGKGKPSPR